MALLRDARKRLRRVDRLIADAGMTPCGATSSPSATNCEALVARLAHRERALQRQANAAVRWLRSRTLGRYTGSPQANA